MTKPSNPRLPTHPGELLAGILRTYSLSVSQLAKSIEVSPLTLEQIIAGHRRISPLLALKIARYFNGDGESWYQAQARYDFAVESDLHRANIERRIKPFGGK